MRRFKTRQKRSLETLYAKKYGDTIKGTSRIRKSVCTWLSQISAEIVLLFAQANDKPVPVHPIKVYGGEGIVPLILKLDTR